MKKFSLIFFSFAMTLVSFSQEAVISFEEKAYDFGKINEDGGKVTHVFTFKNMGNSPLVVTNVRTSCGCTTSEWTKAPVEPGQKGTIPVTYNPMGRPAPFTKTITISSNATEPQVKLEIKGDVIPKIVSQNPQLPVVMGDLRLNSKLFQFSTLSKGSTRTQDLEVQNAGKEDLKIQFDELPLYITAEIVPKVLKPNEKGKITLTYDTNKTNRWGRVEDYFYIALNGKRKYTNEFVFKAESNIIDDFKGMTIEEKRNAPIIETPNRNIDFGVIKQGAKKTAKIRISNKGINSLEIRKIVNKNEEIKVKQSAMSISEGKSKYLIVDLYTKTLSIGDYTKSITIQTNDPDNSYVILSLNCKIER